MNVEPTEDDSRVRHRTAARNLALLRKVALNLVAVDRSSQTKQTVRDGAMSEVVARG
jgi:predicted transposase YbfD/YdcC